MSTVLPTIKQIAKQLNVSVSTVSRALSNHPRIGLGTRLKVQKLAAELGYEPNALAVSFKQKKSHIIGVVVPFIREEFFSQAISGIETMALDNDYTILFGQSYDDVEKEKIIVEAMKKQRVDGLLISLSKETNRYEHLEALKKFDIPVVYFDRVPKAANVHKVYCNLYKGTIDMIGWLINHGYRKIALINGPDKIDASKERLKGYIEGISQRKLKVDMRMVEKTDFSRQGTQQAIQALLNLKDRPQAIISFNDYVHMDVVQYAHQAGLLVNKEIVFVSFSNLNITSYMAFPPLASIEQYPYGQGQKAMELMVKLIKARTDKTSDDSKYYTEELDATLVAHTQAVR